MTHVCKLGKKKTDGNLWLVDLIPLFWKSLKLFKNEYLEFKDKKMIRNSALNLGNLKGLSHKDLIEKLV